MKPGDPDWLKEQIEAYDKEYETYEKYAQVLWDILDRVRVRCAPDGMVRARPKSLSSFARKAMIKKDKYGCPAEQITDLAGARVMVLTEDEADQICVFIRANFLVDQANSEDCAGRLAASQFGYRGIHFVVQLPAGKTSILGVDIPSEIGLRKAEIQVHTLLQSAWAAIGHDRMYKSPFPVPKKLERAGAQVAALLETSDKEFGRLIDDLDELGMNHGLAISSEDLLRELVDLSVLRVADPDDSSIAGYALRQAQLARGLRAWSLVTLFLDGVKLNGVSERLANRVRLEMGRALCLSSQQGENRRTNGQDYLDKVARPEAKPDRRGYVARQDRELRARAAVALANSVAGLKTPGKYDPAKLYKLAMQCDPTSPYHLSAFLDYEMGRLRHADYAELMRPGLLAAIKTCEDQAEVRIELPQAFFVAGAFHLVLRQPFDAFAEYTKGVHVCLDPSNCISISALDDELRRHQGFREALPPEAVWVERLLAIAHAMKASPEHPCAKCAAKFAVFAGKSSATCTDPKLIEKLKEMSEVMEKLPAELEVKDKQSDESEVPWIGWPEELARVVPCAKERTKPASDALKPLASAQPHNLDKRPVLIVAGGTDPHVVLRMRDYRDHLLQALRHFKGTICSGGTAQGIPGMVADVVREARDHGNKDQHLIGYLPQEPLEEGASADPFYDERIWTAGKTFFTPLEPLQNWTDLIAAGVKPSDVRLLGINGGRIAAAEYRLGLALGASVAVVESSGRAVADLLPDVHWWEARNLLVLPADRMAIRAFVMEGQAQSILDDPALKEAAAKVHDNFLKKGEYKRGDATCMPFEYLRDDLQASNIQQVAYWIQILHANGFDVRKAATVQKPLEFQKDETKFEDEIELMAEMEHGRWIVERLRAGWRYASKRDTAKKLSPYLVPWKELSREAKNKDRAAIENLPRILGDAGWEVFRKGP